MKKLINFFNKSKTIPKERMWIDLLEKEARINKKDLSRLKEELNDREWFKLKTKARKQK